MKTLFILVSLVATCLCQDNADFSDYTSFSFADAQLWQNFKRQYEKTYHSREDELQHFKTFLDNKAFIDRHNQMHKDGFFSYTLGMNQFGDLDKEEYQNTYMARPNYWKVRSDNDSRTEDYEDDFKVKVYPRNKFMGVHFPQSLNLESKKTNKKVRSQGRCRAGYAFATTELVEYAVHSQLRLKTDLSEQELIDCSSAENVPEKHRNRGCRGGSVVDALRYVSKRNSLGSSDKYPYIGASASCRSRAEDNALLKKMGQFVWVNRVLNESAYKLKEIIYLKGPLVVHLDASPRTFQFYQKGVYKDPKCSSTKLLSQTQPAVIVGYVKNSHWIVRNSFGNTWGDNGVILLPQNNQCGVNNMVLVPEFELTQQGKEYVNGQDGGNNNVYTSARPVSRRDGKVSTSARPVSRSNGKVSTSARPVSRPNGKVYTSAQPVSANGKVYTSAQPVVIDLYTTS